jgi:recombination protein RecT
LIIDYKGLVALARRSGEISDIHADVVCANDEFVYSFGSEGTLKHIPYIRGERGEVIAVYSFAKLKDGSSSYEVMSVKEIDAIRNRSRAKTSGPWVTDWNEMAKKTVFRRHSKWLPVSSEFQEAIDKDFDVPIDITPQKQPQIAKEGLDSPPTEIVAETGAESTSLPLQGVSCELSDEEKDEITRKEAEAAQKDLDARKKRAKGA